MSDINTKPMENEIVKHLVFACVASNDGKRGFKEAKVKNFSKKVIQEYSKQPKLTSKYKRKTSEIETAIKCIDKLGNASKASYNFKSGKDQHGMGCTLCLFKVEYKGEELEFAFHLPNWLKDLKKGNNNYPKIDLTVTSNNPALNKALQTNEIFESGINMLELYA